MTTRPYKSPLRARKHIELSTRIAAATADLHAKKGAVATSYSDVAAAAGVSLPTVYAHFPTQEKLIAGCTGHVAAGAPALSVEPMLAAPDLASAASLLVSAVDRRHAYFEPWLAWREDAVIPFLAELASHVRDQMSTLVETILARHCTPGGRDETVAAWTSLLSFDLWHDLVRNQRLSRARARGVIRRCLLAVAPPGANAVKRSQPQGEI